MRPPCGRGSRLVVAWLVVAPWWTAGCDSLTSPPVPVFDEPSRVDPDVARAIEDAAAQARQNPPSSSAFGRLGRIYHANEFYDLAAQCYATAASLDPSTPDWPYYLGALAADRGQTSEAASLFREVVRLTPGYAPAWARLGDVLLAAGQSDEAAAAYRRYLELEPGGPWGRVGLGKIAMRAGRLDEAAAHLEGAIAAEPRQKQASYLLATIYRDLGRDDDADRQLERFARLRSSVAPPDALMERMQDEATGAFGILRRANALLEAGRLDDAEALYWEILTRRPDEYTALVNLAQVCLRQRRFDEARGLWQRAVELRPVEPHGHYGLALALLATSRFDAARAELDEVLRLDPDHREARERLRQLRESHGRSAP